MNVQRTLISALTVACLGVGATPPLVAQARLRGRVIDSEMGNPLIGARIWISKDTTGPHLSSDSTGFFASDAPGGRMADVRISLLGYEGRTFQVFLPDSGEVYRQFALDFNGFMLPEVVVQARAELLQPRYIDFERRRLRKLGAFFRWDDLKKSSYSSVGDALRTVRGVRIQCDQSRFECYAVMARTPNCQPTWYIDGNEVHSFHENTPIRDIYGIEVYRGTGEIPAEFGGSNAACGVIVMWTKSRPYR
jgi:hypothetical protein